MEGRRQRPYRNSKAFKGSVLVYTLLEQNPRRFHSRAAALKFAKRLFRDGTIRSVFGLSSFEDSAQLYMWQDHDLSHARNVIMTSSDRDSRSSLERRTPPHGLDDILVEDVKSKIINRWDNVQWINSFFKDLERDFPENENLKSNPRHPSYSWSLKRASTASTDSSIEANPYFRFKEKLAGRFAFSTPMAKSREHAIIPEEAGGPPTESHTLDYGTNSQINGSHQSQTSSGDSSEQMIRRGTEPTYSYSDNEKQLLEEMKRMKKEHRETSRIYEERINKLMAKMHELGNIAEMLESSSTKASPYGVMAGKGAVLSLLGSKLEQERRHAALLSQLQNPDVPPPLPPRPGRGTKVYPNKPIIHTRAKMKPLPWSRIILPELGTEAGYVTVWHSMLEPKVDLDELDRKFHEPSEASFDDVTLFDDICNRRGRPRSQMSSLLDGGKSQNILSVMKAIRCKLNDVITVMTTLDTSTLTFQDSIWELFELLSPVRDIEKVLHHVKRKGSGQLDCPEFLLYEMSKVDHCRERLEFLRFKHKLQFNLFEIDQQLRELYTACGEIMGSLALKNLMESILTVGNYMNGGTQTGQADGFGIDIVNKLKDAHDRENRGSLLEFMMKTYCNHYEKESGPCPTRFRFPEPSNMRHAAQVSFDEIQDALKNLAQDLQSIRKKMLNIPRKDNFVLLETLKTTMENFFNSGQDVLEEQKKLMQETKNYFSKTVAYFMYEPINQKACPQQFFQIWAVFLHDCKYYWKIAHRKLAKEKFDQDFRIKGQQSCSSSIGVGTAPSNSAATTTTAAQMLYSSPSKKAGQTWNDVRSSNNNLDNDLPPELPPRNFDPREELGLDISSPETKSQQSVLNNNDHRPSSPKRLTSAPPIVGAVHKPTPKNPLPTAPKPVYNRTEGMSNYENQEDAYTIEKINTGQNMMRNGSPRRAQIPLPNTEPVAKKNTQFSLKSWLKRDPPKRTPTVDKTSTESTSFVNRIRNTVSQKFSTSDSQKGRNDVIIDHHSPSSYNAPAPASSTTQPLQGAYNSPPLASTVNHQSQNSYHPQTSSRYPSEPQHRRSTSNLVLNSYDKSGHPNDLDASSKHWRTDHDGYLQPRSIERLQDIPRQPYDSKHSSAPTGGQSPEKGDQTSFGKQDSKSPPKWDRWSDYKPATDMPISTVPNNYPAHDDVNNNKRQETEISPNSRPRDRAPILLGSNMSISETYTYNTKSRDSSPHRSTPRKGSEQDLRQGQRENTVDPQRQPKWNNSPSGYTGVMSKNYESQQKIDKTGDNIRTDNSQGSYPPEQPVSYRDTVKTKSTKYVPANYHSLPSAKTDDAQPDQIKAGNVQPVSNYSQNRTASGYSYIDKRYKPSEASGVENQRRTSPDGKNARNFTVPRERAPMNASSISSLIDRFEESPEAKPSGNVLSMTSTPVIHRKNVNPAPPSHLSPSNYRELSPPQNTPDYPAKPSSYPLLDSVNNNFSGKSHNATRSSNFSGSRHAPVPGPMTPSKRNYESNGNDDGYKNELRRAAKTTPSSGRYIKQSPPYTTPSGPSFKPTIVQQGNLTFMEI